MKKTVEVNPRFNVGDIVYAVTGNKAVKSKITNVCYTVSDNIVRGIEEIDITYTALIISDGLDFHFNNNCDTVFKSKDDLIDYLKTQIDRVTTDDYTINYEAH